MTKISIDNWKREHNFSDLRAARICSILSSWGKTQHPPSYFMIDYETGDKPVVAQKRQTPEEMAAVLRTIAIRAGAKVN
jgi:hypothetical protein